MKTKKMIAPLCLLAVLGGTAKAEAGTVVEKNEGSVSGYTVHFSYADEKATNVKLLGGFQFYESGDVNLYGRGFSLSASDSYKNYLVDPQEWKPGMELRHIFDTGYETELERDAQTGEWTVSFDLPGGCYMYQYSVSYDNGETWETIADPTNTAFSNEWGAGQTRSKFFVPYDEKQGDDLYYDWSWATPVEAEESAGTIEGFVYDTPDGEQRAEIYLPAGYENSEEPYKVLYLAHGGGGTEGDWFWQGNAGNILDRIFAEGKAEPFVAVCMNNAAFNQLFITEDSPNVSNNADYYRYCVKNIKENLIPYVEEHYNVSSEVEDKALAGLSQGAKLTNFALIDEPDAFDSYGMFSCSVSWSWPELEDYSAYQDSKIYLAAGFADHYMISSGYHGDQDCTLVGFKEDLEAAEIPYNNGGNYVTADGAHDWFTWQQILKDYVETFLWM